MCKQSQKFVITATEPEIAGVSDLEIPTNQSVGTTCKYICYPSTKFMPKGYCLYDVARTSCQQDILFMRAQPNFMRAQCRLIPLMESLNGFCMSYLFDV